MTGIQAAWVLTVLCALPAPQELRAQASLLVGSIQIRATDSHTWTAPIRWDLDSDTLSAVRLTALDEAWARGYFEAAVDSTHCEAPSCTVWLQAGPRYRWGGLPITASYDPDSLSAELPRACTPAAGSPFDKETVDRCAASVADFWVGEGRPHTSVVLMAIETDSLQKEAAASLEVRVSDAARLGGVEFEGLKRTGGAWLTQVSGLDRGSPITPELIRRSNAQLEQTQLFVQVDDPDLIQTDSLWILRYRLQERPMAVFDLLVGYVPDIGGDAVIAGSGSLLLRNAGWDGVDLSLAFSRLQPRIGRLELGLDVNRIKGLPIGAEVGFGVVQQDTIWQTRSLGLLGWYELTPSLRIRSGVRRETSSAGAGAPESIANLQGWYGVAGIRYRQTDSFWNPTRGFLADLTVESGRQTGERKPADTTAVRFRQNRQRLIAVIQPFIPLARRHVLTARLNGAVLVSKQPTLNDLWRLGGAKSFRGYREEQFFSGRYLWGDAEYRFLMDARSYLFVFYAQGWTEQRGLGGEGGQNPAVSAHLRSFGMGLAYQTNLGMLQFTYAKSPDDPFTNAKVHVGIVADF